MQMKVTVVEGAVELIDVVNGLEVAVELEGVVMVDGVDVVVQAVLVVLVDVVAEVDWVVMKVQVVELDWVVMKVRVV